MKKTVLFMMCLFTLTALLTGCADNGQFFGLWSSNKIAKGTIVADTIARYYKENGSYYITKQTHQFNPKTIGLKVISEEPDGEFVWSYKKGNFSDSKKTDLTISGLKTDSLFDKKIAASVLHSFLGGANLESNLTLIDEKIKIDGQWYKVLAPSDSKNSFEIRMYQNLYSEKIELIEIRDAASETRILAKNYNPVFNKDLQIKIPTVIDLYDIQNGLASKTLLVQFQYPNVK